jgi:aspartate racemase
MNKTMGILGGMGMFATINFLTEFITKWAKVYKIEKEWEYPKYILYANPKLPSRSRHIFYNEESPLNILKEDIIHLNSCNIDFIVIPCNTVHYYYEELQKISKVKILNMIEIVSNYLIKSVNEKEKKFVIGTEAMFKTKLYSNYGVKNLEYCENTILVRTIIDSVKNNNVNEDILNLFKTLLVKDKLNLLCCTELSKLFSDNLNYFKEYNIIDPIDIFIEHIVKIAFN